MKTINYLLALLDVYLIHLGMAYHAMLISLTGLTL